MHAQLMKGRSGRVQVEADDKMKLRVTVPFFGHVFVNFEILGF